MALNRYRWRDLLSDPPTGNEHTVLIWPSRVDCGHAYTVSNAKYAKANAIKQGYRYWMEVMPHPEQEQYEQDMADIMYEEYKLTAEEKSLTKS
jgi:hypothetical protein